MLNRFNPKIIIVLACFSLAFVLAARAQTPVVLPAPVVETVGVSNITCKSFIMHAKITKSSDMPQLDPHFYVRVEGWNDEQNVFERVFGATIVPTDPNTMYVSTLFSVSAPSIASARRVCFFAKTSGTSEGPRINPAQGNYVCFYPWMWNACPSSGPSFCAQERLGLLTQFNCASAYYASFSGSKCISGFCFSVPPKTPVCGFDGSCSINESITGECYRGVIIYRSMKDGMQWISGFNEMRNSDALVFFGSQGVKNAFPPGTSPRHFIDYYFDIFKGNIMPFGQCSCNMADAACQGPTSLNRCIPDGFCDSFENYAMCPGECKKDLFCYRGVNIHSDYNIFLNSPFWIDGLGSVTGSGKGFASLSEAKRFVDSLYQAEEGPFGQCNSPDGEYRECYKGFYIFARFGSYQPGNMVWTKTYLNCAAMQNPSCLFGTTKYFDSIKKARADIDYLFYFFPMGEIKRYIQCKEMPLQPNPPPPPPPPPPPTLTVETSAASDITHNSARLKGKIVTMGSAAKVKYWFKYGATPVENFSWQAVPIPAAETISNTGFDFNALTTSLKPATTYYFKAYAQGLDGSLSDKQIKPPRNGVKNFTTLQDPNGCKNETLQITYPADGSTVDIINPTALWTKLSCAKVYKYTIDGGGAFSGQTVAANQAILNLPKWGEWYTLKVQGCPDATLTNCTAEVASVFKTRSAASATCQRQYIGSKQTNSAFPSASFLGKCKGLTCPVSYSSYQGAPYDVFREFTISSNLFNSFIFESSGKTLVGSPMAVSQWTPITIKMKSSSVQSRLRALDTSNGLLQTYNVDLVKNAKEGYETPGSKNIAALIQSPERKIVSGKQVQVSPVPMVGMVADDPFLTPGRITATSPSGVIIFYDPDVGLTLQPSKTGISSVTLVMSDLRSYQTINNQYFNPGCITGGTRTFNFNVSKNDYPRLRGATCEPKGCDSVECVADAYDPDGGIINYDWRCQPQEIGAFIGSNKQKKVVFKLNPSFTTVAIDCAVRFTDSRGAIAPIDPAKPEDTMKIVHVAMPACNKPEIQNWKVYGGDKCREQFALTVEWNYKKLIQGDKEISINLTDSPLMEPFRVEKLPGNSNSVSFVCGPDCYNSNGQIWVSISVSANGIESDTTEYQPVEVPKHSPPRPYFISELKDPETGKLQFTAWAETLPANSISQWKWYFASENLDLANFTSWTQNPGSAQKNPVYTYPDVNFHRVTLVATDNTGMTCATSTNVNSGGGTQWHESSGGGY